MFVNRDRRRLERLLREARPVPSQQLMHALEPRRRQAPRRQFAFAAALTAVLAIALSAVGGVSYAANAVNHAVEAAAKVVTHKAPANVQIISAGGDQYRPGYGFGDPNHNHSGPPGLEKGKPGETAPPAQLTRITRKAAIVSTSITVDEQAALYFAIVDANGDPLLLTQKGSKFAGKIDGPQTKTIHYVMLVPRTLSFALRIPANLLTPGATYRIRVIAVDADGNKSTTFIPFTA